MKDRPFTVLPSIHFTSIAIRTAQMHEKHLSAGELELAARVPSRDAPEHGIEIQFGATLPRYWSLMPPDEQASWLRSQLMHFVAHEIDEMLFVAGLGRDPHAKRAAHDSP